MSRQQWGWIAAIGLSLLFLLAAGRYAHDTDAIGQVASGFVNAAVWAIAVLATLANLIGLLGAIRESSRSLALRIVNSLAGRLTVVASSLALGVVFLVLALRVEPAPALWSCSIQRKQLGAPDRARCGGGGFVQRRSFELRLSRASDLGEQPTLRARVHDRAVSSVAIDSDRGGLCVATGPDQPTRGESRLVLSTECGADRLYVVNLHLCDMTGIEAADSGAAELRAAVRLEMREGSNAYVVECE